MKKIIGWIIVIAFIVALISGYAIIIYKDGWKVILGLLLCVVLIVIFLFGLYLAKGDE